MRVTNIAWGIAASVLLAFPMAAICALAFRFPVPFSGYESGVSAIPRAMVAVFMYGMVGGFGVLAVWGGIAGFVADRLEPADTGRARLLTLLLASSGSAIAVVTMAILDKLFGPW
jgi:hypothetical protein